MILLDTNVLSELMRPLPAQSVLEWVDEKKRSDLFIPAVTRAEIELGIALLPRGKRQHELELAAHDVFRLFAGRCLSFDEAAAIRYANIVAGRMKAGRPISVEDAQIAAIALEHEMLLATRNVTDFLGIEQLEIVNPWNP